MLFLFIYLVIILAVIEIFVILFQLTGLKVEVSRFQVISMMTGTGFTTGESELILGHPIRRKLAIFLILFGAFSLAVIISSISEFLSKGLRAKEIFIGTGAVIAVFLVLKIESVRRRLAKVFHREMKLKIELADLPVRDVFLKNKEDLLLHLSIYEDSTLVHRTINEAIREHDELELVVLFIQRGDVRIHKHLYDTRLHEGDQLLIYGVKDVVLTVLHEDISIMKKNQKNRELPSSHIL
ncbi:TrkA C-terminal domain-containing protein [Neobacillus cucumis]|uniref:TrkA C-terminal domain-containing protein n=1 Tax=Neobacillus cucumis TaxID=1740721 RepID=UPI00285343D7|nr:TrkA C-terminal domain-containing protein [Neobacillus cucumis]MDR4950014.1 TrkA C-terminal domain-containing protein [Neobacillus cucumis]